MTYTLTFGKHRGESLEWLFFHDPGYVWWLEEQFHDKPGIFPPLVRKQFKALLAKASHLQVPGFCRECRTRPIARMALIPKPNGRLAAIAFLCDDCPPPTGARVGRPSFRTPDLYHEYDKAGGKLMVTALKAAYFGDPASRMTEERIQAFFADPAHFHHPQGPAR